MILVGLTGGIGSGKSVVAGLLVRHGAVLVDADLIVRDLQRPGEEVLRRMVDRFGSEILADNGQLDRAHLADRVFGDPAALSDLNAIVHPAVGREMMRRIDAHRDSNSVVVLDVPLLVENPRRGLCATVVVDLEPEIAVDRLVKQRGLREDDARSRVARQVGRFQRRAVADWIIDNSGSRARLATEVAKAWRWMRTLPPAADDAGRPQPRTDS